MDFGCLSDGNKTEFLQCKTKYFLAAFSEWKIGALKKETKWLMTGKNSWKFLYSFGAKETGKQIEQSLHLPFIKIPYSPDIFYLNQEVFSFLSGLRK